MILCVSLVNLYYARCRAVWLLISFFMFIIIFLRVNRVIRYSILVLLIVLVCSPWVRTFIRSNLENDVRPYIWQGTLHMIAQAPLIGVGAGNFFIEYPKYRPHEYFLLPKASDNTRHAHNELLEVWAETGSFGVCLLLAVFACVGYGVFSAHKQKKMDALGGAVVFSSAGILLHNMVDVNMRFTAMAVVFWCNLGILSALYEPASKLVIPLWIRNQKSLVWSMFILCCAGVLWYCVVQSFRSEVLFQKGYDARVNNDLKNAVAYYEKAVQIQPNNLSLLYHAAFAFNSAGQREQAVVLYDRIMECAPYYASVHKNSAICNMMLKHFKKAVEQYITFSQLNPYDPETYLNLSYCLHEMGDTAQSRSMQMKALEMYVWRAEQFFNRKEYRKAREYLETPLKIAPDNSAVVIVYARSCAGLKDTSSAVSILKDYLKRFPNDQTAQNILKECVSDLQK
ncbi:tetratricopeptide repeat protein [bacterium]|nr:tetratricopeptide repeat protein [bacterium]